MTMRNWPSADLVLRTPRLELRLPGLAELDALGDLAAEGVHDPAEMPFAVPWTDAPPAERARAVAQYHWKTLGELRTEDWRLPFAVFADGVPVGIQEIAARDFAVARTVHTGSWLGLRHQGRGIGTEMRRAVLHLAFEELGAEAAITSVLGGNTRSMGVSRRLGYRDNGITWISLRGRRRADHRMLLERADWRVDPAHPVRVTGLERCRSLLGCETPDRP
ncbi:GNAT family N-acetyltransferase [Streptomonospora nanhaiensis]|uniref:RimJ/RimL family protein N-acetyltransferase n=1 Tax=Streptomonospora nanhaiensis TaxID=1323731 RepID=A0A853BN48_9ACTN|nr:GNAT family protein [Streptomonospora nanhaiensis]MBX9387686.1 GNAT family N-acetyltransferase [Streptomonospora nanhaiensis]NYI96888.1 RimJ/RimL family protein N-acetyltransferase [Streptomonospora nanhaiensis]